MIHPSSHVMDVRADSGRLTAGLASVEHSSSEPTTACSGIGTTAQGLWLRTAYGNEESMYRNKDGTEGRVAFPVLDRSLCRPVHREPAGGSVREGPARVAEPVGSGRAFVFADGMVVEGTWDRAF